MSRVSQFHVVLLSVCASLLVIVAAIAGVIALWQPSPLESFLPNDRTELLFRNAHPADIRIFLERYPRFTLPELSESLDIAIVTLPDGTPAWIASPVPYRSVPEANVTIGRQHLLASDARVQELLKKSGNALASAATFRSLSRGVPENASRIYVRKGNIDDLSPLRLMLPGASQTGAIMLAFDGENAWLRMQGNMPYLPLSTAGIRGSTPSADTIVMTADAKATLDALFSSVSETDGAAQLGKIQKRVRDVLPGEWSWTYDILPLLDGAGTLRLRTEKTGNVAFLYEGTARDAAKAKTTLEGFHAAFRATLPGTIERRVLDKGLVSTVLKSGEATQERTWNAAGFSVRATSDSNSSGALVTAVNGKRFLVGNSVEWAEQVLKPGTPDGMPLPGMLRGIVSGSVAADLLSREISPVLSLLRRKTESANRVEWAVRGENGVLELRLRSHYPTSR